MTIPFNQEETSGTCHLVQKRLIHPDESLSQKRWVNGKTSEKIKPFSVITVCR